MTEESKTTEAEPTQPVAADGEWTLSLSERVWIYGVTGGKAAPSPSLNAHGQGCSQVRATEFRVRLTGTTWSVQGLGRGQTAAGDDFKSPSLRRTSDDYSMTVGVPLIEALIIGDPSLPPAPKAPLSAEDRQALAVFKDAFGEDSQTWPAQAIEKATAKGWIDPQ